MAGVLRATALGTITLMLACAPARPRAAFGTPPDLQDAEHINAATVPSLNGFSQAVRAGVTVYVSGQVALDSAGTLVGGEDLRKQLDQSLANLATVLRAARALPADVVHMTVYVVGYTPENYAVVRDALTGFTPAGRSPALTLVGVSALPVSGLKVAIDAVAHVRGQFIDRDRLPGADLNRER